MVQLSAVSNRLYQASRPPSAVTLYVLHTFPLPLLLVLLVLHMPLLPLILVVWLQLVLVFAQLCQAEKVALLRLLGLALTLALEVLARAQRRVVGLLPKEPLSSWREVCWRVSWLLFWFSE